jgi:hypothetical protein
MYSSVFCKGSFGLGQIGNNSIGSVLPNCYIGSVRFSIMNRTRDRSMGSNHDWNISTNVLVVIFSFFPGNEKNCSSPDAVHKVRQKVQEDMDLWLSECIDTGRSFIWLIVYEVNDTISYDSMKYIALVSTEQSKGRNMCRKNAFPKAETCVERMFFLRHFWVYTDFIPW